MSPTSRRAVLAAAIPTTILATAGCLGDEEPGSSEEESDPTGDSPAVRGSSSITTEGFEASLDRPDTDFQVELSLSEPEAGGDGGADLLGRLTLTLGNAGPEAVAVATGVPEPFDVLVAEAVDGDERGLLWTDAYEESRHVTFDDGTFFVNDFETSYELGPGESRSETYELHRTGPHHELDDRWGFEPGEYLVAETIRFAIGDHEEGDGEASDYPLRLRLQVPEP